MQSHEDLKVWQESMNLVEDVYALTRDFQKMSVMGLLANFDGLPFPFHQILQRERVEEVLLNGLVS